MKINSLPLALLAMLIFMSSAVQAAEIGRPLMTTYGAQKTNGHFQNWAFIQDQRGIMYVGNGFGVQEFDGSSWRMIVSPNRSFARSFAQDSSGRIYVGSGAELGYLETDDSEVKYVSLLNFIDEKERSFTTIASVQVTPEGIYFLAFEKLFRFRRTSSPISQDEKRDTWDVKVWSSQTSYRSAFWVDHNLYVSQIGSGLLKLQNDSLRLVPGSEQFKDDRIRFILPFPQLSHTHLVAAGRNGLFLWDGQTFEKFSTEADDVMRDAIIYDGVLLPDSCFAVSTLSEGFFILSSTGKIISHFTKDSGLISNTIQALYVDRQQNLWVGMDGGIAILEYHSPLSQFTTPTGIIPNSILRYDDQLYAACNYGVYVLDQDSEFRPVTLMSHSAEQVFQLYQVKKELFACMGSGIAAIKDKNAWLVYRDVTVTASCLYACWQDSSTILVGTSNGAIIFHQDARNPYQLDYVSRIAGLDEYVYTITEQEPGIFWLGTFDEGAIRIKAPDGDLTDAVIERFGPEHNLPAGTVMVYRAAGRLFFTTTEGVFRFDEQRQQFEPDPLFAKINLGMNSAEGVIVGDSKGNIWANLGSETVIIKKNADGSYQLEKQTLSRFADEPVFSIYPEKDGTTWFGAVNRLLQYAPIDDREMIRPVASLIRKVVVPNDSTLFYGGKSAENSIKRLPFKLNELHFEYALPSFIYPDANEFQTKLEGFDRHWSEWSRENRRYYTNIPAGEYRFIVKARNINHQESESAVYAFTILRPWYSTLWAWVLYLMCGGGFIYLLVQMRTRQLRQRSRALEKIVQERTTEIQSQKNNVEQLSLIGQEITDNLSIKDIINTVYENVNTLMAAEIFGIGLLRPDGQTLVFPATKEKGATLPEFAVPLDDENRLAVWCFKNRHEVMINDYGQEYIKYIQFIKPAAAGENPESILYLPLVHKDKPIGVITAQSFGKNAYTDYHLNMLRNLATYSAIALENADAYRRVNELLADLKATQDKLVTQSKLAALGALTAGIAHEIKNPLNFVNNFSELSKELIQELEETMANEPADRTAIGEILATLKQNADKINEHGRRADNIVRSMLQHSRGKSGERQLTDVNAMLVEDINLAYHGMRAQDSNFNIKIETELDPRVGRLDIVPQDISRVFLNIISNACYAAHHKKLIVNGDFASLLTVKTIGNADTVEIRIRDNGDGIPDAIRDKLFTPFFTTKPTGQGTGLGLSISYDVVVHEHNGQLFFESHDGEYAEFIIKLPRSSKS